MKDKYELKTTVEDMEALKGWHGKNIHHETVDAAIHDARLAHALMDRLAFLERVAEQMVDFAEIKPEEFREGTMYSRSTYDANGKPFDFVFPDLAAYLRASAAAGAGDSGVEK